MMTTWTPADKPPRQGTLIYFVLKSMAVTFRGWYADGRYNAETEDREQVWFPPEDVKHWQYSNMPNDGEVVLTRETP